MNFLKEFELANEYAGINVIESNQVPFSLQVDLKGTHKYVCLYRLEEDEASKFKTAGNSLLFLSKGGCQLCLHFLDQRNQILEKKLFKSNQIEKLTFPKDCEAIDVFVRVHGNENIEIRSFQVDSHEKLVDLINENMKFRGGLQSGLQATLNVDCQTIILTETLFCDVETRGGVLNRYFSFLVSQLEFFQPIAGNTIFWVIHMSRDKKSFIDTFSRKIAECGLDRNVFINIYDHPAGGYGNENESHIDRRLKPNATYPILRDGMFKSAVDKIQSQISGMSFARYIRGVLDDDDFLSYKVFNKIDKRCNEVEKTDPGIRNYVLLDKHIVVSYFDMSSESVEVHCVDFVRALNGCKFTVSNEGWPIHPYAVSETVEGYVMTNRGRYQTYDLGGNSYNFSYNRHIANLSNGFKGSFYEKLHEKRLFLKHQEFTNDFLNN